MHCAVQILIMNAASLMTCTNARNHTATNYFNRTLSWTRLQLRQQAFFCQHGIWVCELLGQICVPAAADNMTNIWDLLPRYTSLVQPPLHIMHYLEYLVVTMQQLMGPLPVTDWSLEHSLSCLRLVLSDFEQAQDMPDAPRLFSMLPQSSNHTQFITMSSTSLQK